MDRLGSMVRDHTAAQEACPSRHASRYVTSDRDCTVPSICALRPEGFLIVYVHVRGGVLVFEEVVCFFYYYLPVVRVEYS